MPEPNYVAGRGAQQPKLIVCGEAPGREEDESGLPFVGDAGKQLDGLMEDAGHPYWRSECYVTNVSKFRPPGNDFKRLGEVTSYNEQVAGLWDEIRAFKPSAILALGDTALSTLTGKSGIYKYRGSILQSTDGIPKVIATLHPSNLVRHGRGSYEEEDGQGEDGGKGIFKYAYRTVMVEDIKRAFAEAEYPDLRLPERHIQIARNSSEVYSFLKRFQGSIPQVDIESFRCIPICLSIAFNRHECIVAPLFRRIGGKIGAELCTWPDSDIAYLWNILYEFFLNNLIMGQNIKYDIDKLMMLGFRFRGIYSDNMMLSHTVNPESPSRKHEFLVSTLTREPYYKDEGKEWNPKLGIKQLFNYNGKDSTTQYEVHEELDKELDILGAQYGIDLRAFHYDYVMRLFPLYFKMENRGVNIDESARERIRYKYEKWHEAIQERFIAAVGHPVNVMANDKGGQVWKLVYEELKCPQRRGVGEDTLAALMQNNVKDERRRAILSDVLDDRRVRKTTGTYINAELDFDGRLRTSYRICGTETGRSSTGVLKPPLRPEQCGMAFQTITKHGDIGADIREFIIPDKGKVFVQIDKSQAEARVVSVLSKDYELLDAFNRIDIHRRTAALIFDYTNNLDLSDICRVADEIGKDSAERFMGKKTRHAGNYNMKKNRFMKEVTADAKKFNINIKISEWKAGQILDKFHAASPKIRGVFHQDIRESIDNGRVLTNPYGRFRMFFEQAGEDLYKEAFAFIPQSTVHDSLTQAWIRIDSQKPDIEWLMEAHDSLLLQIRVDEVNDICKLIKKEFEVPISFRSGSLIRDIDLVIPCDFEIGYESYSELQKITYDKARDTFILPDPTTEPKELSA